jgi:hypothetical protein
MASPTLTYAHQVTLCLSYILFDSVPQVQLNPYMVFGSTHNWGTQKDCLVILKKLHKRILNFYNIYYVTIIMCYCVSQIRIMSYCPNKNIYILDTI